MVGLHQINLGNMSCIFRIGSNDGNADADAAGDASNAAAAAAAATEETFDSDFCMVQLYRKQNFLVRTGGGGGREVSLT